MIILHSAQSIIHRLAHAESETLGAALARVALHQGELIAATAEARRHKAPKPHPRARRR